jgi:hypothetical protein
VKDSESLENSKALRLVEDDTAALRPCKESAAFVKTSEALRGFRATQSNSMSKP